MFFNLTTFSSRNRHNLVCVFLIFGGFFLTNNSSAELPENFQLVGYYKLQSKIKVEGGQVMPVVISPLNYRVYSDGMEVRVYCGEKTEGNFITYQIYRSDGIATFKKNGDLQGIAGVQGLDQKGEIVRQISVTRNVLTMVNIPPRSHRVIVTRAVINKSQKPK